MIASIELGAVLEAEDGAQDCLEGDRLHGAMKGNARPIGQASIARSVMSRMSVP